MKSVFQRYHSLNFYFCVLCVRFKNVVNFPENSCNHVDATELDIKQVGNSNTQLSDISQKWLYVPNRMQIWGLVKISPKTAKILNFPASSSSSVAENCALILQSLCTSIIAVSQNKLVASTGITLVDIAVSSGVYRCHSLSVKQRQKSISWCLAF